MAIVPPYNYLQNRNDVIILKLNPMKVKEKVCRICKEKKALTEFAINTVTKDGKQTFCKMCGVEMNNNRCYSFCGLENDITGFGIGKAISSRIRNKYFFVNKVRLSE